MRRFVAILAVCLLCVLTFEGCSGGGNGNQRGNESANPTVVSPKDGSASGSRQTPGSESPTAGPGSEPSALAPTTSSDEEAPGSSDSTFPQLPSGVPWPGPAPDQPPAQPPPAVFINGLEAAEVTGLLEARGFTCGAAPHVQTRKEWACQYASPDKVFDYFVYVYGHESAQIYAVNALFVSYKGVGNLPLAADFLGPLASVPYDDGDPEGARAWVEDNISSTDAKRTFGSAAFSMYGLSYVKILEMTAVAPS